MILRAIYRVSSPGEDDSLLPTPANLFDGPRGMFRDQGVRVGNQLLEVGEVGATANIAQDNGDVS